MFSKNSANVKRFGLGTWTENVARVLIQVLAGVDYISIIINYVYRKIENSFLGKSLCNSQYDSLCYVLFELP